MSCLYSILVSPHLYNLSSDGEAISCLWFVLLQFSILSIIFVPGEVTKVIPHFNSWLAMDNLESIIRNYQLFFIFFSHNMH